ncbi:hypothetical protein ACQEU3_38670 [Spirillospora sp. CA-253888]
MSFCWDVYVWIPRHTPELFQTFIDRYVDPDRPGDERLAAFVRTYITGTPSCDDAAALAELRSGDSGAAFTIYLRGRVHPFAMITITGGDAAVLGLSFDDPDDSPQMRHEAERLLRRLRQEFSSPAGIAGVEMPPPWTRQEWQDEPAPLRVGVIPGRATAD